MPVQQLRLPHRAGRVVSAELEIPGVSSLRMLEIDDDWEDDAELFAAIQHIAAPIVAAELRGWIPRVEALVESTQRSSEAERLALLILDDLQVRAAELDAS